jgi:hypothetical protein
MVALNRVSNLACVWTVIIRAVWALFRHGGISVRYEDRAWPSIGKLLYTRAREIKGGRYAIEYKRQEVGAANVCHGNGDQ